MIALARKYRPKKFSEVAVQDHVSNTLRNAIAAKRVAHGYLLAGPRGVGKTTLARVLAMALNCENGAPGGEPCGECTSCARIWSGAASLDVVEIDAASNRGVDDARELRERAMYAPSGDERHKVYIVDEAHMLTREAWNTLLKILEEPPPRVVFVFATTEPYKIAQAAAPVMSRLQRFDFKRISPAEIRARLESVLALEKLEADPEAIAMIARAADGSMRDALSLTDQVIAMGGGAVTAARVRDALGLVPEDEYVKLLDLIADRRAGDVFPFIGRLADAGIDWGQFISGLGDTLRAQLSINLGGAVPDLSDLMRRELEARKGKLGAADLLRMLTVMSEGELRFKRSSQQQLLVETLLVRFALQDRTVSLEDVLKAIGSDAPDPGGASPNPPGGRSVAPDRNVGGANVGGLSRSSSPSPSPSRSPALAQEVVVEARAPRGVPDLAAVTGRWDDLIARVRSAGKVLLAAALESSSPQAITRSGDLRIKLDEPNDFHAKAIEQSKAELLGILAEWFDGIREIRLHREESPGQPADKPKRVTDEMIRAERLNGLRRKDAILDAAIEVLDLEIADQ
jgi:DNA polymerase-3 subunit gamma/tau